MFVYVGQNIILHVDTVGCEFQTIMPSSYESAS